MFDLSFHKTPKILSKFFPSLRWNIATNAKEIYLTFDDGPIPQLTEEILDILKLYGIKATFFCVGENVLRNPDIYKQILADGHTTGNHTHQHLKAWKVNEAIYLNNILKAEEAMLSIAPLARKLFRPPHGQFTPSITKKLLSLDYEIIMWDILTKDYLINLNIDTAYKLCTEKSESGSIIVFHDNLKARNNVLNLLPMYINEMLSAGYKFKAL